MAARADLSLATLNALSADELAQRLAGPAGERLALVRAAADAGVVQAQMVYGQMLLDGREVTVDAAAALRWFTAAARTGDAAALNMVGRCYDQGWGTAIDKDRAAQAFRAAAERGLDWGMYNYATLLALGQGVDMDRTVALGWLRKAAALGNGKAENFIGSFHEDGWACPRDLTAAAACYARAAAGGDFRGQFNHARMLIAAGALDDARDWLARAAAGSHPRFLAQAAIYLYAHDDAGVRSMAALFAEDRA